MTVFQRFMSHVEKTPGGCWVWTGSRHPKGYGSFKAASYVRVPAHRWMYEHKHGPLSPGIKVLHKCDNPPCVRPSHLFQGSTLDNNRDCVAKGRHAYGERNGKTKFSTAEVEAAKAMFAEGIYTQQQVAAAFGMNRLWLGKILRGQVRRPA